MKILEKLKNLVSQRRLVATGSGCLAIVVTMFAFASSASANGIYFTDRTDPDSGRLWGGLQTGSVGPGTDTIAVKFLDVNGDGLDDIFFAEGTAGIDGRSNRLLIYTEKTYSFFGHFFTVGHYEDESEERIPDSIPANTTDIAFGDFDSDGDLDVLLANLGPDQLLVNDGDGYFSDESKERLPAPPFDFTKDISTAAEFGDFNGDGQLDIVIVNEIPPIPGIGPGGAKNFLFIQEDGVFYDESDSIAVDVEGQSNDVAVADIDADNDLDLIIANIGQNHILLNDGYGDFEDATYELLPALEDSSRSIAVGKINRGRRLDIIVANSNSEQNRLLLQRRDGSFRDVTRRRLPAARDVSNEVELIDLDDDGDLDIYFANAAPNPNPGPPAPGSHPLAPAPNTVYLNDGKGRFTGDVHDTLFESAPDGITFDVAFSYTDQSGFFGEGLWAVTANGNDGKERLFFAPF